MWNLNCVLDSPVGEKNSIQSLKGLGCLTEILEE